MSPWSWTRTSRTLVCGYCRFRSLALGTAGSDANVFDSAPALPNTLFPRSAAEQAFWEPDVGAPYFGARRVKHLRDFNNSDNWYFGHGRASVPSGHVDFMLGRAA